MNLNYTITDSASSELIGFFTQHQSLIYFAVYLLSDVFHTLPLTAESLTVIGLLSLWVFGMIEIRKWVEYFWGSSK